MSEDFSSEEYVEKLKEGELKKQREQEKEDALKKNSYLKDTLISDIIEKTKDTEKEEKKEFSSEDYYEKLKEKAIKQKEIERHTD
jgi:hypothetical protein